MLDRIQEITRTIHFKLLASLLLLLGLSIAVSLFGIWTYERDHFTDIARDEALRAARTVEKSLRHAMLKNDWEMIRHTVADIYAIVQPSNLSILAVDGTVAVSGDRRLEGRRFDREREAECTVCHQQPGTPPSRTAVLLETANGPVLRNVIKVVNEPACHGCHPPEQKNLGIFIYDAHFDDIFTMLRTILVRTLITGAFTFLLVAAVISLIVRRYVHRPLRQLEAGFVQVGRGDFNHWVEVEASGEIQDMAVQFNVMSQAIKRSFAEIKRKNWETEHLYAFVRQLGLTAEWDKLRQLIIDLLFETFAVERVALLLTYEKQEGLRTEITWRTDGEPRSYCREYDGLATTDELPSWITGAWEEWRRSPAMATSFAADDTVVLAPLTIRGVSLGLLCLRRAADHPFSGMEKKLLAALVEQIEIVLALHDITEQARIAAQLEEKNRELNAAYEELKSSQARLLQQEKLAAIGQLAAGVAHEINTPVGFVTSNLSSLAKYQARLEEFIAHQQRLLEQTGQKNEQEEAVALRRSLKVDYALEDAGALIRESLEGVERVKVIVQNLKNFARVDQARFSQADINQCLEETLNIAWNELKYKAEVIKEYGELPQTWCHPQQLNQVFLNLLINAAQAIAKQGKITINSWSEDGSIFIAVTDTGGGIAPEHLSRIFEPFFTTKPVGKGTGLGLSIVYDIVKQHGGDITAVSAPGGGTTFRVRLPVRVEAEKEEGDGGNDQSPLR